jgi:1-acyl-sn-glycerol-3-phosphate acyltransferase
VRKRLARLILEVSGWRVVGEVPRQGVLVGAPHTSNWDFVLMLLVMWHGGVPPRVLMKKELFVGPLGWFLRRCGGIPIDRSRPAGLVQDLTEQAHAGAPFLVIIAAEGTRRKSDHWKSGFYRIACGADLPITLAFVDGPTRTTGIGPTLRPSGDVEADMNLVRAFYADKRGVRPALRTEPRLREEGPVAPDGHDRPPARP